ncbi:sigma-54 dependent transcriptional regulator [Marinimicrobium sp. ABcell2]|uniref:sigma-54-dependent transcriptional regulator n=1 Tax=Marinimicrobium sp. ABcell2 TaxID=3069751 RepID=UPI0027AF83DB|nr:sigma-54 dependent transcriptional regulator [Marinimicrobium sp. ABcell2]MDQ2078101.1 sigma-54 dependent transcriptional regulator [Marinimicrobium sp. ABcell2]
MALAAREEQADTLGTILVVEDDNDLREALCDTLHLADYTVVEADSAEEALRVLARGLDIGMIVSDINMGGMSGQDLLREVKRDYPQIPMLLITAYASISQSVDAMKQGAVDYLVKPFAPQVLVEALARHLGVAQVSGDEPIAVAQTSQQLLQLARRVAMSDSTALIVGESGTGKEVLARYVHNASPRSEQPFIAVNCAAIPENMLEAMLFGHEKGAYTGAHTSAPGKFEQANGGTLLLDEISEMDIGLQAKLLRVLQEREVERVGGRKTIKLDVRVIATSNRDMRAQVVEGKFREDLYYRLSVLPLQWAPLRDRKEDIIPLAEKLLVKHAQKQNRGRVRLSDNARQALLAYPWPGNVRELDNVVQRALILQPGHSIDAADLALEGTTVYSQKPDLMQAAEQAALQVQNQEYAPVNVPIAPNEAFAVETLADESPALGNDLKQREYEIIMDTLKRVGGSRKKTAERLGISARTLRYKVARLKEAGFAIDG